MTHYESLRQVHQRNKWTKMAESAKTTQRIDYVSSLRTDHHPKELFSAPF